ncbi:MAG: hypothetical protein JNM46_00350 [Anaerolineales bacterium]|nr:hypothetical protein [Anaerolineales bacterium]
MKSNFVAIASYPLGFFITSLFVMLIFSNMNIETESKVLVMVLFVLPFFVSSTVSGLLATNKPVRIAVFAALLNQLLMITILPLMMKAFLFSTNAETQSILASLPPIDMNRTFVALVLLSVLLLPLALILALIGGLTGSKIRKLSTSLYPPTEK